MNVNKGSWFGQSLAQNLEEMASNTDLESILRKVQDDVMNMEFIDKSGNCIKQTPSIELRGWTKLLYFLP